MLVSPQFSVGKVEELSLLALPAESLTGFSEKPVLMSIHSVNIANKDAYLELGLIEFGWRRFNDW